MPRRDIFALTTASRVGDVSSSDKDENEASLVPIANVTLGELTEAYSNELYTEEDLYDLYRKIVSQFPAQVYQRSSGTSLQRKVEHRLAPLDHRVALKAASDGRAKTPFKLVINGDQAIWDGFEKGKNTVMITSVDEMNCATFAVLTFIPQVDKQLRKKGYLPTEKDAIKTAYEEVAQQFPRLAYKKSEKKLSDIGKSSVDYVTFTDKGMQYLLFVPLVHEVSFYNQMVVLKDRFRQNNVDFQVFVRNLIAEVEKLRLLLKSKKPKLAGGIDRRIANIYDFFVELMIGESFGEILPTHSVSNHHEASAEPIIGHNRKRILKDGKARDKKAKCIGPHTENPIAIDQELVEEFSQIGKTLLNIDDPKDPIFTWMEDLSMCQ